MVHVREIFHEIIQSIFNKTINHGSCTIREFGKFVSFVTPSTRLGRDTIRFKFSTSSALMNRIKNDTYLLNNLPVKSKHTFEEQHEQICEPKRDQRDENFKARNEAEKLGREKTQEFIARQELMDLLDQSED